MFSYQVPGITYSHPIPFWQADGVSGNLDAPPTDSETALRIRSVLCPLIRHAGSWPELTDRLHTMGYGLTFRGGRLFLTDHTTGARVCSLRLLGMPLHELVARLGRPSVRALPGRRTDDELMCDAPLQRKN